MQIKQQPRDDDFYPSSDGQPMAESTDQFDWIVKIKENLERLFAERDDVFIAGDLFWYPLADRGKTKPTAPDVLVAFGRPKGRRGSYKQWEEDGIAPQVVFEVWSVSNKPSDIADKLAFYQTHGAEEFYGYDPRSNRLDIWLRQRDASGAEKLVSQPHVGGWTSPRLGVRFAVTADTLELYFPSGEPFLTTLELDRRKIEETARAEQAVAQADRALSWVNQTLAEAATERARADQENARAEAERTRADQEHARAEVERARADQEHARAEAERTRAERLAARLRSMGLDLDD
jgi:Uma2 family endonuclease